MGLTLKLKERVTGMIRIDINAALKKYGD